MVTTQTDTTNQSQSTNVPNVVNSDQVKADIKQTNTQSDSVTQKQISHSEDISILQDAFVNALSTISALQSNLLAQLEQSFIKSIEKSLSPVVAILEKLLSSMRQMNESINKTEDTTKLNATIKQLQEENKSLQMDKFNSAIELSKVESQLQMEKHQHDMLKNKRQTYMNSLLSENEILREKLVRKTEECEHLSNEQKQLNEKLSVQFDDIITLKSQITNSVNANDRDETVFREVYKHSSPLKMDKPTALLIGTSNINYMKPDKLTRAVSVSKSTFSHWTILFMKWKAVQEIQMLSFFIHSHMI